MINAYYKYCMEKCVLPQINNNSSVDLSGSINGVDEAKEKYDLILELLRQRSQEQRLTQHKTRLESVVQSNSSAKCYNIMLSYAPQDKIICHRLVDRLTTEGFAAALGQTNDSLSLIDGSGCVIIYVSQHYFNTELCEQETKDKPQRCAF
ncbi:unnamed protein product [Didymodactylos carnosus]|uniref:TIR domain-containing protein n=1 Tax=Didymodactylos carnosus TaxID=1234261 RepID=A0A815QWZ7_9BILA|nr:unnamed protein product [Didymodactylos carnosus]CAF4336663.1 unnamed protein product [Didymodactylos carnosus]